MTDLTLLQPPTAANALTLSQSAPSYLKAHTSWSLPWPLSLFSNSESQEKWQIYENILLACLRTGDNDSAKQYLQALTTRFGPENERVAALRGLYAEATASNQKELEEVMKHYEEILKEDPSCFSIRKRRVALLKSMGRSGDAISALTNLLDTSPTDAEAWAELADLYLTQGMYEQAIFSLEEVLLLTPNAWNVQAKMGEVLFLSAGKVDSVNVADQLKVLSESMRRFCRSVELCDFYLRGYYGLKLTTSRLLDVLSNSKKSQQSSSDPTTGDLAPPSLESFKKLNELATAKLAEIIRRSSSGDKEWDGYSPAEIAAARDLLDRDVQKIAR